MHVGLKFAPAIYIPEKLERYALTPARHSVVESLGKLSNLLRSLVLRLLVLSGPGQTIPEFFPWLVGAIAAASWEHKHGQVWTLLEPQRENELTFV